jgi:hypothetical protein
MHFAKYEDQWMASSHFGSFTIRPYQEGWSYSGPGVHGHCGPKDIADVIKIVTRKYELKVQQAYDDLIESKEPKG